MTRRVRAYARTTRWQQRVLDQVSAAFMGLWLGLMDRSDLDLVDEVYYRGHENYVDPVYNSSGLRDWEAASIEEQFPGEGRIVVTGAGGGREVLALLERGFDAVGYEPNGELAAAGAAFLAERGHPGRLHAVERDLFPATAGPCAAVVVGWGSYMLIPGRDRRIAFLRAAHAALPDDAPILVSFFTRAPEARSFRTTALVANLVRRVRRRPRVDLGDTLGPNYIHHFTRDELAAELAEAGFRLLTYEREPYGHAVARAT